MTSRLIKILVALVILAGLIVLAASWYLSSLVLYPKSVCRKEHYVYCNDPSEIPVSFENVSFTTSDEIELKGWYMPATGSGKTIVLVHGHGGSKNEGLRFVKALHDAGFNLLVYDSRVLSGGNKAFASMGYFEKKDVKAAIDWVINKKQAQSIGVFGFSMGAATSILAMEEDLRIKAGMFSSSYASVVDELAEVGKRDFGLPEFPILPVAIFIANIRGDMDLYSVVPERSIPRISPRPVYIMQCKQDDYVDYSHAQRLYKAAKDPKSFWGVPCNRHEYLWNSNPEKVETQVVNFFKLHL
ncbi:alpha/beta fold hydrolase [bacterium]|nr:alpha/beta fold hydrolase [bacterium]